MPASPDVELSELDNHALGSMHRINHPPTTTLSALCRFFWFVATAAVVGLIIFLVVFFTSKNGSERIMSDDITTNAGHPSSGSCSLSCEDCPMGIQLPPASLLPLIDPTSSGDPPWYVKKNLKSEPISINNSNPPANKIEYTADVVGVQSGASFAANPRESLPAESAVLSYSVYFPQNFAWVRGGKLPGVCIGDRAWSCATGGNWSETAGSVRVMWHGNGVATAYVYIPTQVSKDKNGPNSAFDAQGPDFKRVSLGDSFGTTGVNSWCLADGGLQFVAGAWNNVTLVVAMSTPNVTDGILSLTVNGVTRSVKDVTWRTKSDVKVSSMLVQTFFGGSSIAWASPTATYTLFNNYSFAAPANLTLSTI